MLSVENKSFSAVPSQPAEWTLAASESVVFNPWLFLMC